ncbi:hypothetical protein BDL97_18G059300 [Sphagnum fallax]|nr:hypothetical protein BDL97_18G059300 [Sphagnum fallax]
MLRPNVTTMARRPRLLSIVTGFFGLMMTMALLKATELEGIGAVRFHVSGGPLVVDESTHSAPAAAAHHHLFATALTDCEQVEDDQLAGANSAIDNYYIHGRFGVAAAPATSEEEDIKQIIELESSAASVQIGAHEDRHLHVGFHPQKANKNTPVPAPPSGNGGHN